jgi:hypothetical protein
MIKIIENLKPSNLGCIDAITPKNLKAVKNCSVGHISIKHKLNEETIRERAIKEMI